MTQVESIQILWERVRQPGQDLEALGAILDELQAVLDDVSADAELRPRLRMQREELPDLRRLITKKHGAILQGRLQDSIGKLRTLMAPQAPPAETPEGNADAGNRKEDGTSGPEARPFRNMPNLGME
jgi:hypothetical protein